MNMAATMSRTVVVAAASRPLQTVVKIPRGVVAVLTYLDGHTVTVPAGQCVVRWTMLGAIAFVAPRFTWYDAQGKHVGLIVSCLVEPKA